MSAPTLFYSWQSDLPPAIAKTPIAAALNESVRAISGHPRVVSAPRLDQGTQDVGGTPEIAGTIFRKIERSAVVVADTSITSLTTKKCPSRKYSPNANVMLETGYAAARLGWDRIVFVMNDRFGGPTKLPFDLRNRRWPVTFSAADTGKGLKEVVADLATRLTEQLNVCFASDYRRAEDAIAELAPHARRMLRRLAIASGFSDGKPDNNLLSRDDYHTHQMIRLGLIECVADSTDLRSHMVFTYLGRECCRTAL